MALANLIIATACLASPTHPELCAGGLPKGVKTEIVAPAGCDTSSWAGNPNGSWAIPDSCHVPVAVVWREAATGEKVAERCADLTHRTAYDASSITVSNDL